MFSFAKMPQSDYCNAGKAQDGNQDKTAQQEADVLFITVESLKAELSRLKSENESE